MKKFLSLYLFLLLLVSVTFVNAVPIVILDESFDGVYPPAGWFMDSVTRVGGTVTTPHSPDYCVYFNVTTDYFRTSLLANPGDLAYWYKRAEATSTDFWIQVGPTTTGPWTAVQHVVITTNGWHLGTVSLADYNNVYVRFSMAGPTTKDEYCSERLYIDDLLILEEENVPVELSSFTATLLQQVDQNIVELRWTTQSETQVAGYNVFRNNTAIANNATQLNLGMIEAANTSVTNNYTFSDIDTEPGTWYYWLQSNDMNGTAQMFGPISIQIGSGNDQDQSLGLGVNTLLKSAYPNPFNLKTSIPFQITSKADVKLEIYNQKGQLVWHYAKGNADIGMYNVEWNGRDMNGRTLSSGVYFCRMTTDNYLGVKKLFFQK
jgi:hypothetical protein